MAQALQETDIPVSSDVQLAVANRMADLPVSYTHLTLPTTPYV